MKRATLRLTVGPAEVRAVAMRRGRIAWTAAASYATLPELTEAIARLAAEPSVACGRLIATLEEPLVQLRIIPDLPPVRPPVLAALVEHQASRFFRKNGVPLVTDAAWVDNGGVRLARAAAAAEPLLEAIAAGAREAGLQLQTIVPRENEAHLELLPAAERATRSRDARRWLVRLVAACLALWVGAAAVYVSRLVVAQRRIEARLAHLQQPLQAVVAARRELRDAEATLVAVRAAAAQRGRALTAMLDVATRLPDSSVVTSLVLRADGSGVIGGLARSALAVSTRFVGSAAIRDARLDAPVTREAVAGRAWERFTIAWPPQ